MNEDYYQDNPLELMREYTSNEEYGFHVDTNAAARVVIATIKDNLEDEIYVGLSSLPESYLDAAMEPSFYVDDLYDQYRESHISVSGSVDGIDRIFR